MEKKYWRKTLWLESPRNPFLDNHTSSKAMFANYLVAKITGLKLSLTISWLWICNNEVWHLSPCLGRCSPCRLDRCLSSYFPGSCTFEFILDIMKLDLDSPSQQHMHYHVCLWNMSIKILVGEKLHSIHEISFCSEDNYFRYLVLLFVCRTTFETNTTRYQCRMIWQDFHKAYQKHLGQQQLCKKVKQFYMILQKLLILKGDLYYLILLSLK